MIFLFLAKYLFYLWIGLYLILSIFGRDQHINKIFFYIIGIIFFILYEIRNYYIGGFSFLAFLGLSLNLAFIFLGLYIIKNPDKESDKDFGYIWTFIWTAVLIYLLNK